MSQPPSPAAVDEKTAAPELSQHDSAASPTKEGGLAGWTTVFGAFCGLTATFGQVNTFGSYQAYYIQHQLSNHSPSDISWIGSLQLWLVFFSGLFVGRLFDAYGPKRLILLGTILTTLSLMLTSICTRYYEFLLAQGVLLGIGTGLVFYPAVSATQTHFVRVRATASSAAVAGSTTGGIIFPLVLQKLFIKVGFAWAVRITGFISLAGCLVAFACCTSRLPPRAPGPFVDIPSFKDVKYMTFSIGCAIICLGIFVPFFYVAQFAQDITGASEARTFDVLAAMNAGSVLGRPIPGIIADVLGRYNLMTPCTLMAGLLCLTVWLTAKSYTSLMCFSVFYGFFSGAIMSLTPSCVAQISQREQIGMRVGLAYAIMSFPSLVGGPVAGVLLSKQHGSYEGMIVFAGVTLMVGSVFLASVKLMVSRDVTAKV